MPLAFISFQREGFVDTVWNAGRCFLFLVKREQQYEISEEQAVYV